MGLNKIAFLDRDGVINEDKGYVHLWKDFKFCEGSVVGLRNLVDLKFKIIIITNQSGIDRGIFSEKQYFNFTNLMIKELMRNSIDIAGVYGIIRPDVIRGWNVKTSGLTNYQLEFLFKWFYSVILLL